MSGILMMVIAIVVLGGAYLLYGRYLQNKWGIDPNAKTPAYEMEDGVDYVPADTNVVFGHQFASIAGAGPINGPIQAAIFGWLPVLLWVLIGGVFFGAVQDFASMYASVKNKGRTIGFIIEEYIGRVGKKLFLAFCWLFCILVIAAFADVVAGTFNGFNIETGAKVAANGSVAMTSIIFIVEAVALGMLLKYGKLNKWVNTAIAIALLIFAVVVGLVLFAPIMLVTAGLIKLTSPGPLIYKQERVGLHNRPFNMYKFRSMEVQEPDKEKGKWTTPHDPRVTPVGRFIRKTSIDEMPQLFNVLLGDMSLVGPRPERPFFVEKFKEEIPRYMIKHQVRPGMTGWAQVNGYRGDTSIVKRIEHDLYYIENWTLGFDFKILFLTFFKGFINKNAY